MDQRRPSRHSCRSDTPSIALTGAEVKGKAATKQAARIDAPFLSAPITTSKCTDVKHREYLISANRAFGISDYGLRFIWRVDGKKPRAFCLAVQQR